MIYYELDIPPFIHAPKTIRAYRGSEMMMFNKYGSAEIEARGMIDAILAEHELYFPNYECRKCGSVHRWGKIYEEHMKYRIER